MRERLTYKKHDHDFGIDIRLNGVKIGTVMPTEYTAGKCWAWSVFSGGRFGGSSTPATRPATLDEAKLAIAAWLRTERDFGRQQEGEAAIVTGRSRTVTVSDGRRRRGAGRRPPPESAAAEPVQPRGGGAGGAAVVEKPR